MKINDPVPNFSAQSTKGDIEFHEWCSGSWTLFFSHPKDFTPVCATEISALSASEDEFKKRNCKLIGLSVDSLESHFDWLSEMEETYGSTIEFPIIADKNLYVSKLYNMLPADTVVEGPRSAADNATVRTVYIISPDLKIKMMMSYPMTTGRDVEELLRVVDSIQLTSGHKVATPVNWRAGQDVIIAASVSDDEAKELFPEGWKSVNAYTRLVGQPNES